MIRRARRGGQDRRADRLPQFLGDGDLPPIWQTAARSSTPRRWPRTRATKLYDRTRERLTREEVERIRL